MQAAGCRFTWSPRLLLLELLPPSGSGCGSFRCPSCSFHPAPAWFSSETSASWVLTVALAPDSERTFDFGRSLCSVSGSTPSSLVASWCGGLGACLQFFPFPFPFGVVVTPGLMNRELEGFFPSGCFLFQLWGCPVSALAVAGKGGSVLRAHPFFGTFAWCLFMSLLFPSYATRCHYDILGVLASGSGLAASACSYACGRCLRIALGPGHITASALVPGPLAWLPRLSPAIRLPSMGWLGAAVCVCVHFLKCCLYYFLEIWDLISWESLVLSSVTFDSFSSSSSKHLHARAHTEERVGVLVWVFIHHLHGS